MYADVVTKSMDKAIKETYRRRERQMLYNEQHGIVPTTISKAVHHVIEATKAVGDADSWTAKTAKMTASEKRDLIVQLEREMKEAAKALQFERAAELRDLMIELSGKGVQHGT